MAPPSHPAPNKERPFIPGLKDRGFLGRFPAIYTSGSTGHPKGVAIEHRSIVNHCYAVAQQYDLRPGDRVVQFSSLSFDIAAEEMYPTWARGATLVLRQQEIAVSVTEWHRWLEQMQVSVLNLPTAYWHHWTTSLAEHPVKVPSCVRLVIIGGEEALPDCFAQWGQCVGTYIQLVNGYGPTECTITTVLYSANPVNVAQKERHARIPIGRSIANTRLYVLDECLQPVPIGVVGELYIGGASLARGYLNRADLTAARFLPNPYAQIEGERFYRTGDLVRYLPDGNLEYIGRGDRQVKIRGYRVELSEITSTIQRHPSVQKCVVLVRENPPENKYLVAYLVCMKQQQLSVQELRRSLQQWLPDYMVPTAFVQLEEFPLAPNGKIDHQKLLTQDSGLEKETTPFTAAHNLVEEQLVSIWKNVLNIDSVGIDDNFFALGGNSLLAVRIISRVRETFQVELPLQSLFGSPTISELAFLIAQEIGLPLR